MSLEDVIDGLNEPQRRAVERTEGPLLVLAGAGTGKTRVVTVRLAHLLAKGNQAENLLAVTFTNKAAREMKERVSRLVGKKRAKDLTISTFHSFAVRLLREHGTAIGLSKNFGIADDEDLQTLVRGSLRDLGVSEKEVPPRQGRWIISTWKNKGLNAEGAMEAACDDAEVKLAFAYRRVEEEMRRRQVVDFDDMMLLGSQLLREDPDVVSKVRDRFRYLMVDEYQDTNRVQFEMIKAIAAGRNNIAVVGDDDQSIYGWRGAESGFILSFGKHFPGAEVVTLDQNYRSTNRILRAANSVIGHNIQRLEKNLWSAYGEGERIQVFSAADEREEMNRLVISIESLISGGAKPEDIAVLFRANAQSNAVELRMREKGIAYDVVGTFSLFDRREVKDILAYLKVIANPKDDGALLRILNRPSRGIGNTTRDKLLEAATEKRIGVYELIASGDAEAVVERAAPRIAEFRLAMAKVEDALTTHGVAHAMETLLEVIAYNGFLEMDSNDALDAEVRKNIVESLVEAARREGESGRAGLMSFLERLALDQKPDRDDPEPSGVILLTVHAAKGLEYRHVFLIGVEETLFPHRNSMEDEERLDAIDEERRLFYVALTRARETLHLSWSKTRHRYGREVERERSRFIDELDEEDLELIDAESEGPADETMAEDYLNKLKGLFSQE